MIALLLAGLMACSLVACTSGNGTENDVADTPGTEVDGNLDTPDEDEPVADEPSKDDAAEETLGKKLEAVFREEMAAGTDMETIANKMAEASGYGCMVMAAEEGYLNGFSEEVKGFTKAVQFAPMIGSIPFVGYIFEVENPEEFLANLESIADPRWNICTQADETVSAIEGNYVFFTMCPGPDAM